MQRKTRFSLHFRVHGKFGEAKITKNQEIAKFIWTKNAQNLNSISSSSQVVSILMLI